MRKEQQLQQSQSLAMPLWLLTESVTLSMNHVWG